MENLFNTAQLHLADGLSRSQRDAREDISWEFSEGIGEPLATHLPISGVVPFTEDERRKRESNR
jgi:hypothetical protein